jgi:hypothetical protein
MEHWLKLLQVAHHNQKNVMITGIQPHVQELPLLHLQLKTKPQETKPTLMTLA